MKIYLFDTEETHANLLPLSFTRPVAAFRSGIMTIREKWEKYIPGDYGYYPVAYLRDAFGTVEDAEEEALFITGNLLPDDKISGDIGGLAAGEALFFGNEMIAFRGSLAQMQRQEWMRVEYSREIKRISFVFDLFLKNFNEIRKDFRILKKGRKSAPLPRCTRMLSNGGNSRSMVFVEEGADIECITINVKNGPVYIGKGASLMEGACLRGPLAVCEESEVRMGAKIYGGTTIGPHCKVGGEVNNTVFFGYSNKAHDGYLGNAVIGEWCNIGAGVNASNLKNDYSLIRLWNYNSERFMRTELQFCGLIMGDHSKIGVNCMLNTATVMGVGVNLHGGGLPRTYLANFTEGSAVSGFSKVPLPKFMEIADRVMARRQKKMGEGEKEIFEEIYGKFS